ncbi:hypothetical protein Lesp02_03100 [Lentzea sp. NBRC 105346]|uniref:hypothetical protein n=1 Tax=Lentzea sp. NBRC 105346 TaxID=3032205 RepID=UPI0024A22F5C|nr:hypothetical protein [Lentzea sp. NBRC 105346]GLZ28120.1 hypothetical protein Lesp02_03100 [Lentzea sp. NBRC 105346]
MAANEKEARDVRINQIHPTSEEPIPDVVCRTCSEPLNTIRPLGGGHRIFVHGGNGARDHEPDPVPREDTGHVRMCCDFCGAGEPSWSYTADEISAAVERPQYKSTWERKQIGEHTAVLRREEAPADDLMHHRHSAGWAACEQCAALIELRDAQRLLTRVRRLNSVVASAPRRALLGIYTQFMRTIKGRTPIPARPTDLPAIRPQPEI